MSLKEHSSQLQDHPHPPVLAFIVGHSRGGTTWMSRCLANHPDIAVFGETLYWGRKFIRPNQNGYYRQHQIVQILERLKSEGIGTHGVGNLKIVSLQNISDILEEVFKSIRPSATPAALFLEICKVIADKENKKWVIEKTPHHLLYADRIKRAFPNARFIIMFREPYGFMLSYKHQLDRFKSMSESERAEKQKMYHPLGCALIWKQYARTTKRTIKKYPESTLLVDFERIRKNPRSVIREVLKFLGLTNMEDIVSPPVGTSFPGSARPELTGEDIFWMNLVAAREMRTLGFNRVSKIDTWSSIVKSILKIPLWCAHVLRVMKKHVEGSLFDHLSTWVKKPRIGKEL